MTMFPPLVLSRNLRELLRISRIVIVFTIFHLIPLALALVVHGTEYAFDLRSKLTLGRGIVFFSKVLGRAWAWWASIDPVVFRTIDVVAVPRFGSIVKIRILIALEMVGELILVVRKILPKKGAINQSKMAIKPTEKKKFKECCKGCKRQNGENGPKK
jgi:hypothetical protein